MECTPPGNILAKVVKSRADSGNFIGFALLAVAGEGTITSVDIKGQASHRNLSTNNGGPECSRALTFLPFTPRQALYEEHRACCALPVQQETRMISVVRPAQ